MKSSADTAGAPLRRVLVVVGDASEALDTLYPYYRLQEAGLEPVVAGPEKRVFQMVMHGVRPVIPAYAGGLEGRRIATVAKFRHDVETAGGIYVDAPCVVDGNLVSGRTYHDNGRYLGPWIEQLLHRERSIATSDAPPPPTSPRRKPVG